MIACIDIDGTIDKFPELYDLLRKEYTIVFLTTKRASQSERAKQLKGLGILRGYTIHIVDGSSPDWIGYNKAMYCKDNNVDLVIENSQLNASYIREYSQKTKILLLY